uniref:Uncharacterized protein n=1 Tax=Sphaerodactylus townsendi TaxID=933632 RepID=A0ACB8EBT3_9SAUR
MAAGSGHAISDQRFAASSSHVAFAFWRPFEGLQVLVPNHANISRASKLLSPMNGFGRGLIQVHSRHGSRLSKFLVRSEDPGRWNPCKVSLTRDPFVIQNTLHGVSVLPGTQPFGRLLCSASSVRGGLQVLIQKFLQIQASPWMVDNSISSIARITGFVIHMLTGGDMPFGDGPSTSHHQNRRIPDDFKTHVGDQ